MREIVMMNNTTWSFHTASARSGPRRLVNNIQMDIRTKQDYRKAQEIVRASIHRIDPFNLLAGGCPNDEFDSEIDAVVFQLTKCNSGKDVAHAIARILNSAFSVSFALESFEDEGLKIYLALKNLGSA